MAGIRVINPNGVAGTIPEEQLDAALQQGYRLEENTAPSTPRSPNTGPGNAMAEGAMSAVKGIPGVLAGLGVGAVKGVGDAIVGAGEMVHKIPGVSQGVDALYGAPGLSQQSFKEGHASASPQSTSESWGKLGANVGMMALSPTNSIPAAMAGNALLTGTQTGGNPLAMATSGVLGGAGQAVGAAMRGTGKAIQGSEAAKVATTRTAKAAKTAGESIDDPLWMEAKQLNASKFSDLIRQFGLTGGKADIEAIKHAPVHQQEVLSALSNQLSKPRQLGHLWSILTSGAGVAGAINPAALTVALPLAAQGILTKYPGQSAAALQKASSPVAKLLSLIGGSATSEFNKPQY